jgi:hypothetical protein
MQARSGILHQSASPLRALSHEIPIFAPFCPTFLFDSCHSTTDNRNKKMSAKPSPGSAKSAPPSAAIQGALTHVLRPLVRLMLAHGITYPALTEILKGLFVEVAGREFTITGKAQTDSRISLLSGVHRKDVKRLRENPPASSEEAHNEVSLGSQIVAEWIGAPEFTDKRKHPLPLPRLAREASGASFESLVESVSKDIRSRAVLDEWLRLGIVHIDESDRVCLNQEAFVPEKGFAEKAFYLGHNLHDHAAAAVQNVLGVAPAFLERSVHYDALSASSVAELAALSEKAGMEAVLEVNRKAMKLDRRDAQQKAAGKRMTFGIYFFAEDFTEDKASS